MTYAQILSIVWKQFATRKLRSALTVIGIMIGISALVSLVILSSGLKNGITSTLDSFGSDTILLAPKASLGGFSGPAGVGVISDDDVKIVEGISQVRKVDAYASSNFQIEFGRESFRFPVQGFVIDSDIKKSSGQEIHQGRFLESTDSMAVNIGYNIAHSTFEKEIAINSFIKIDGTRYRVVGIFAKAGDQQRDSAIYMSLDDIRRQTGQLKAVSAMSIRIMPGIDLELANTIIKDKLKRYRGEEDFATTTPTKIKEQVGSLLGVVDLVILSIAAISLLIGALGIMNSLYTSVLQRTKEIGTMKAVGATNVQILFLFLFESALLGLVGGIAGVIAGLLLAYAFIIPINLIGVIKFIVSYDFMFFIQVIIFSVVLGMISGFLPAYRASRLKPVDALRYE